MVLAGWSSPEKYPGLIEDELTCTVDASNISVQGMSFVLKEEISLESAGVLRPLDPRVRLERPRTHSSVFEKKLWKLANGLEETIQTTPYNLLGNSLLSHFTHISVLVLTISYNSLSSETPLLESLGLPYEFLRFP